MTFRLHALDPRPLAPLFALGDDELVAHGARRVVADAVPGFPCRVSLEDAQPGDRLLLIQHVHQPADTPYRASHAIYVREGVAAAVPAPGEITAMLRSRTLSLRAFDADAMIVGAELVEGEWAAEAIARLLGDARVDEVHVHFAAFGCYAARARRD